MGKYMTVILGLAVMACGAWAMLATWPLCWRALLATLPAVLLLAGLMAVLVGLGEIRDSLAAGRAPEPPSSTAKPS